MSRSIVISSDPIADMLTRVRNAIAVNAAVVEMPHSKLKETVEKVNVKEDGIRKSLVITINNEDDSAKITEIKRLSRPGRRTYVKSPAIPTVKRGRGLVVISTSAGIMTGTEAKAKNLGGELICEVY
jgi:small subunit ribosomal protein S8